MSVKKAVFAALIFAASALPAAAQSTCPAFTSGLVLTAAQWQACFDGKQNVLGYTPLNKAGDTMLGRLVTTAPGANTAGLNLTPGTTPASPANGDIWNTTAGFFVRVNGVTIGPLAAAASASFAATSPITVSFPAGVVTYAFNFSVANTFLAQQTNQGATTTSPGWYAQVAGDTVPRVRVGLNATDVPSLAFGPGSGNRDAFIERVGPGSFRFGSPDAATAVAQTLSVQNIIAGTSNTAGGTLTINGSQGTGTGVGGSVVVQVAPAGSTGSTVNALAVALTIDSTKKATFAGALAAGATTITGSFTATGLVTNADLVSPSTTVNGQTCTLGSTCTVTAAATAVTVGTTTVGGGTTTRILYDNAGVLGEYTISGSGTVVAMQTGAALITPAIGVATGTSLALGGCTISANALCATGTAAISSTLTSAAHAITSASASALAVGLNGSTNPALQVDASTATSATGLKVKSAAAAGGLAVSVITSGTNENLTIDAAGSGTITLGGTSTGAIVHTRATTLSAALTYGGVTLNNAVSGTGNMALTAGTTFTGTTTTATLVATTLNGNTFTTGTYTLTGTAAKTLTFQNSITLAGTDATTWTGPSTNATLAVLNIASQLVTGGFINTPANLGTISSGTTTLNCGTNQLQYYTNGGAHTLAAPANDGQCIIRSLNNGSAGAITFTGFTNGSNVGDTPNTGNGNAFAIQVWRINGVSRYLISAYQ